MPFTFNRNVQEISVGTLHSGFPDSFVVVRRKVKWQQKFSNAIPPEGHLHGLHFGEAVMNGGSECVGQGRAL